MVKVSSPKYKSPKRFCKKCGKKFQTKTRGERLCEKCWEENRSKK